MSYIDEHKRLFCVHLTSPNVLYPWPSALFTLSVCHSLEVPMCAQYVP